MKKLFSITLVVVLVLSLSGLSMAQVLDSANITVTAEVGPYAQVLKTSDLDFGLISGAAGMHESGTNGAFTVESNTDVNVNLKVKKATWIASPYQFTVQGPGIDASSFGTFVNNLPETNFTHLYQVGKIPYEVLGLIEILQISAQPAGNYSTKILVTVSK